MTDQGPAREEPDQHPSPGGPGASPTPAPDALRGQRFRVWLWTLGALLLLISTVFWQQRQERARVLADAASASQRGAARLADELSNGLNLARVAIAHTEQQLQLLPAGADPRNALNGSLRQRAQLLAAAPLPMALHAVDHRGRWVDLGDADGPPGPGGHHHDSPPPATAEAAWRVEPPSGPVGGRYIALHWPAAPNPHGIAAFVAELDHAALLARFEKSRALVGGGVTLFRVDSDTATTVLARTPHLEAELGQRVQGPVAQALAKAPIGVFEATATLDGQRRVVAYHRLQTPGTALVVAHGVTTQELLAPWTAALPAVALVTALFAAGILAGALRLDRVLQANARGRQRLQSSENHFRALAENLPDVVVRLDQQGRHLYASPSIVQLTSQPAAALLGRPYSDMGLSPATVAQWARSLEGALRGGQTERVEFSHQGPQGLRQWEALVVREPQLAGEGPTALVISRDVTDRHRALAQLRHSEQRFRLAASHGQVWEWDFGAGQMLPGETFFISLGYATPKVGSVAEGLSAFEALLHPDDYRHMRQVLVDHLHGRGPYQLEFRALDARQHWRWFETKGQAVFDDKGRATYMAGTTFEITARRHAEEEVRQLAADLETRVQLRTAELALSEARHRAVFETVPVAVIEEDWSGVQQQLRELRASGVTDGPAHFAAHPGFVQQCQQAVRVVRINQKAADLQALANGTAAPLQGPLHRSDGQLLPFVQQLQALWQGQRQCAAQLALAIPGQQALQLMMTVTLPALADGDGSALVCLVDITEIDRLNAELGRSLGRLRQMNQDLETFTYSVSHDLKAPLRGIDGYSRLLLVEHKDRLDEEGQRFLGNIRTATQQMGKLIDDLLAYSRLERRELLLGRVPLLEVVQQVVATAQRQAGAPRAEFVVDVAADLHALCDAQGLTIALRNLVDNAVKFSRDSQPARIRVAAHRQRGKVLLTVQDNGPGFDMKFRERIFGIFQRLHRAEDFPGTGVGLAIVRKAMERMGGQVDAVSQVGQGATFTLELPEAP